MILAAGFGTRLKPLTEKIPKALVPFGNEPMINYQINKLIKFGFNEIVVNAHHFANQITDHFKKNTFGIKISVIEEEKILGTGGGILNAEQFLKGEEYFLVINVDIFTNFDIRDLMNFHKIKSPFASLAIQKRKTKRHLEFSSDMKLLRRENESSIGENLYAFNGIHIISNKIFKNRKIEYLDIIDLYIDFIKEGENILGFDVKDCDFKDLGKEDSLKF